MHKILAAMLYYKMLYYIAESLSVAEFNIERALAVKVHADNRHALGDRLSAQLVKKLCLLLVLLLDNQHINYVIIDRFEYSDGALSVRSIGKIQILKTLEYQQTHIVALLYPFDKVAKQRSYWLFLYSCTAIADDDLSVKQGAPPL